MSLVQKQIAQKCANEIDQNEIEQNVWLRKKQQYRRATRKSNITEAKANRTKYELVKLSQRPRKTVTKL